MSMNAICLICSELLRCAKSETASAQIPNEIVTTTCGHIFHRECLHSWIVSAKTCPTCRAPATSESLIKLFFEFDDSRANFNIELILKANDELKQKLKDETQKSERLRHQLGESEKEKRASEHQKQLDDLSIAGLNKIKESSSKDIVRQNQVIQTLKLDLLAERQLRRTMQLTLRNLDPDNDDYNCANLIIEDSSQATSSFNFNDTTEANIKPFWKYTCEPKPEVKESLTKQSTSYIIPNKIQKAAGPSKHQSLCSLIDKSKKSLGYNFKFEIQEPSVSKNPTLNRTFGEGFRFGTSQATRQTTEPKFNFSTVSNITPTPLLNLPPNLPNSLSLYRSSASPASEK